MIVFSVTESRDFGSSHPETHTNVFQHWNAMCEFMKQQFDIEITRPEEIEITRYLEWEREEEGKFRLYNPANDENGEALELTIEAQVRLQVHDV